VILDVRRKRMKLKSTQSDDPAFVRLVASILNSAVAESTPDIVTVIQIKNWFDKKWLKFSGKVLGAFGIWKSELTVPPFHPNRVISQTVSRLTDGQYEEFEAPPLHVLQPSSANLCRKMRQQTDSGVFAWWTSNTVENDQGSLMVYTQIEDESVTWFLGFKKTDDWKINKKIGITDAIIEKYMKGVERHA